AIVKTFERDVTFGIPGATRPGAIGLIVPPNLTTKENIDHLVMEIDIANATGKIADNFKWPTIGKPPERYPFTVTEAIHGSFPYDTKVMERELKTLDYFGFNNAIHKVVGSNTWLTKNNCYSQPDIEGMKVAAREIAAQFYKTGAKPENIAWIMQMDEPQGQPLEHIAQCPACTAAFREWLQQQKVPLADLGATSWDAVKPVVDGKVNPALYYYSQKFRVHALGKFLAIQHDIAAAAYGVNAPTSPNFSDGATYAANLYMMGIDYFDLLDSTSQSGDVQNALWSENWGNGDAGSQCTTYNVELMRSAAMKAKQTIGQYLITYYGRLPWDIKLNAVSQAARDVKVFDSFWYGPSWAGHEGGTPWRSSAWHSRPFNWYANAELTREFGGSEDLLYTAKKSPSPVGIIYSSSSDIWTVGLTTAFGFDRLFTWTALTHAQIPVDFLSEKTLAQDSLKNYRVLYLSGPNLAHAAADKLVKWVKDGGTLVITAGAAARDEYNRPQTTLDEILPGTRGEVVNFEGFVGASGYLGMLHPKESVSTADHNASLDVLCVKQSLTPKAGSEVLASYADTNPAYLSWKIGKGRVYQSGFLPGLSYIFPAITARKKLETEVGKINPTDIPDATKVVAPEALLRRTQGPWDYPAAVRDLITAPVRASDAHLPIVCDTPLVDAVLMESDKGAV
ncbi:MAG: beta-galactosidase trimerization domain-containing protein, partial [Chthoniobacterales bacterium]